MDKEELKEILDKHEKWLRREEGGHRADLSGADLSGAYLSGAYLSRSDLSGADLSRSDLSGAYLSRSDLSGTDLSEAYLRGADLSRSDLSGADLRGADLRGVNLKNQPALPVCQDSKWNILVFWDDRISIGCETKTQEEWQRFFKNKEKIETEPDTSDYTLIKSSFKYAVEVWKYYKEICPNWGSELEEGA